MRESGVCQPGLTCVKGVANGEESFTEQMLPTPQKGVFTLGIACPETNARHGVKRDGFGQTAGASAQ